MELRKEFARRQFAFDVEYPLVNVYIAMDNHHFIAGNIHDFDWAMASPGRAQMATKSWDHGPWFLGATAMRLLVITRG